MYTVVYINIQVLFILVWLSEKKTYMLKFKYDIKNSQLIILFKTATYY